MIRSKRRDNVPVPVSFVTEVGMIATMLGVCMVCDVGLQDRLSLAMT